MFITRTRHQEIVDLLQANLKAQQESHSREIDALNSQIADLRSLVFSPMRADDIPPVLAEADSIITQNEPAIDDEQADEELRERDRLFSGAYEGFQ